MRVLSPRLWLRISTAILLAVCFSATSTAEKKRDRAGEKSLRAESSDRYLKKWLKQDVKYIITSEERKAFRQLTTDDERYQFIEQFWLRRDPNPDTIVNETRDEHYRRIAYANERFSSGRPGWMTDRGRIYIAFGPPDQIESHPTGGQYYRPIEEGGGTTAAHPYEVWRYRYLQGESLGSEIIIEFVDPTGTGQYHMTIDPAEKDAVKHLTYMGPTLAESMEMANQGERFQHPGRPALGSLPGGDDILPRRYNQFQRMSQQAALFQAPRARFQDLEAVVDTRVSYNLFPFDFRTDFFKITDETILTPITIQLQHKDMTFKNETGVHRARVNIYGRVSTITGRVAQVFEDVVSKDIPDSLLKQALEQKSLYQRSIPLNSGRYKLELVLKDLHSGNVGTHYFGLVVPRYPDDQLGISSIILADRIEGLPPTRAGNGMFVIGASKVHPNVREEFEQEKTLGIYFQIYNLTLDDKTRQQSARIDYDFMQGDRKVARFHEERGHLAGASQQMTLGKLVPLKNLAPGDYRLVVHVTDNHSQRSVRQVAQFVLRQ